MRLVVDLTRCQGYGQCAFAAPDVFRMHGNEGLLYEGNPDDAQREEVVRAAASCPVRAILLDEGVPGPGPAVESRQAVQRVVVVGASLAGLRAAHALRREGFSGSVTVIGDEPHEPYDRVALSKNVLTGRVPAQRTALPGSAGLDAEWLLDQRATGLDRRAKHVVLADGRTVDFDRVLIATGVRARRWPRADEAALDGVFTVRTRDDAAGLRQWLAAEPARVLVIGAGFIGSEVASDCRELDLPVTVVERGPTPLAGALGAAMGRVAADLQREHGVDLRCGVSVEELEGDGRGRVCRARLSDGSTLDVDVAVVALGAERNVEWLDGAGLAAGRWGVACDAGCRAFDVDGVVTDDVFVAGDVARFPHPLYDYQLLALEHWGNAVDQAEIAAHNMVSPTADRWAHLALPVFWSTQFGTEIKSIGVPTFADEVVLAQGSPATRRFVAAYGRRGRITAAVAFDQGMWLEFYGRLIEQAAPFPPDFPAVDAPRTRRPVPAEIHQHALPHQATVVLTGHAPSERRAVFVRD
ncbi:FAD-dependent oxidoreductase [Saccharopolyspora rosea]|uniref:FAD-dependent oxidoreductase n=1 Tax=Saccharopolyspora rosea TaxID=524884 RepID=A0ABW3FY87_9PSEU|nr:FAD-dependent oxidoreductase [Saccharopolyspora rosea]